MLCARERAEEQPFVHTRALSAPVPRPGADFTVTLLGRGLSEDGHAVAIWPAGSSCASNFSQKVTPFAALRRTARHSFVSGPLAVVSPGEYQICCFPKSSPAAHPVPAGRSALLPFAVRGLSELALRVLCSEPEEGEPFPFSVSGAHLRTDDAFTFVRQHEPCPPPAAYSPFHESTDGGGVRAFSTLPAGDWVLCFSGAKNGPVLRLDGQPVAVAAGGSAAVEALAAAAVGWSARLGIDLPAVNGAHCPVDPGGEGEGEGLQAGVRPAAGYRWGPLQLLRGGVPRVAERVRFGARRYPRDAVCLTPVSAAGGPTFAGGDPGVLALDFSRFSLGDADAVRVFTAQRTVLASNTTRDPASPPGSCPSALTGMVLVASYSGLRHPDGVLHVHPNANASFEAVLVVCTDGDDDGGSGFDLDVSVVPRCPRSCGGSAPSGVVRGTCEVAAGSAVGKCRCVPGWRGEDCTERVVCSGYRESAARVVSGALRGYLGPWSTCGFDLQSEPQRGLATYDTLVELLVPGTTLLGDCERNYIRIHENSWKGPVSATVCPADLALTSRVLMLARHQRLYVEVSSSYDGGELSLRYKPVSTVCPGDPGPSGLPTAASACSGAGVCVSNPAVGSFEGWPTHAKMCACDAAFAATRVGGTCDRCAFGFRRVDGACVRDATCTSVSDCGANGSAVACVENGCVCEVGSYGRNCSVTLPPGVAAVIAERELGSNLVLRYAFDEWELANVAPASAGTPDTTRLSCESNEEEPCVRALRTRGNVYTTNRSLASGAGDRAVFLNHAPFSLGGYLDQITVPGIARTPLDAAGALTVTAWVKLQGRSAGFLVAKVDHIVYKNGENAVLRRSAAGLQGSAAEGVGGKVYFGVYLDAARRTVVCTVEGPEGRFTRDFGVDEQLFHDEWHHLAVVVRGRRGHWEGQAFVDGQAAEGDRVECLPFAPVVVDEETPAVVGFDAELGMPTARSGGMWVVGYNLSAAIDEVRVYTKSLTQTSIIEIASTDFAAASHPTRTVLWALGTLAAASILTTLAVFWCVCFQRIPRHPKSHGSIRDKTQKRFSSMRRPNARKPLNRGRASEHKQEHPRVVCDSIVPHSSAVETKAQPSRTRENTTPKGLPGVLRSSAGGTDAGVERPEAKVCPPAVREKMAISAGSLGLRCSVGGSSDKGRSQSSRGVEGGEGKAGSCRISGTTVVAEGSGELGSSALRGRTSSSGMTLSSAAASEGEDTSVSRARGRADVLRRIAVARDTGQILALLLAGWEWPAGFSDGFGAATFPVSLDLARVPGLAHASAFAPMFYAICCLGLSAFGVLFTIAVKERDPTPSANTRPKHRHKPSAPSPLANPVGNPENRLQRFLGVSAFFVISWLYLPVTRSAISILRCHRDVQCIWSCLDRANASPQYTAAFATAATAAVLVTIGFPIFVGSVVYQKVEAFDTRERSSGAARGDWRTCGGGDKTASAIFCEGLKYKWAYFDVYAMLWKSIICVATVGLSRDSDSRLFIGVLLLGSFAVAVAASVPLIDYPCVVSLRLGLVGILICVALNFFPNADPSNYWGGPVLISAGCLTFGIQFCVLLCGRFLPLTKKRAPARDRRPTNGPSCKRVKSSDRPNSVDLASPVEPSPSPDLLSPKLRRLVTNPLAGQSISAGRRASDASEFDMLAALGIPVLPP
ncbi:hypothetical protein DIPPA_11720 [Diplonema papillatum]|nr:hypothetical protein DIPPA_11720 [Diplonema papillatum]